MKPISLDIVEKTWNEIGGQAPEKGQEMINRMSEQQPIVLAYLMSTGEEVLNQDEKELLLYLGVVVWQMMSQGASSLPEITSEMIDEAEDVNMKMIEYLEGEPETAFMDTVEKMINNYNQPEVLRYVLEALMEEEPEEDCIIRDENIGIIMIFLKTVIDCFDK